MCSIVLFIPLAIPVLSQIWCFHLCLLCLLGVDVASLLIAAEDEGVVGADDEEDAWFPCWLAAASCTKCVVVGGCVGRFVALNNCRDCWHGSWKIKKKFELTGSNI